MSRSRRQLGSLLAAVVVVAAALLAAFQVQRDSAVSAGRNAASVATLLAAQLDMETGVRGFTNTGREEFLAPYLSGQSSYEQVSVLVANAAAGDATTMRLAAAEDSVARAWQAGATTAIADRRRSSVAAPNEVQRALDRKAQMDRFRDLNAQLRTRLDQRRDATLRRIGLVSAVVVAGMAGLFALFSYLRLERKAAFTLAASEREIAYRVRQREFTDLIQAVDTEDEAHQMVQRHLQRSLTGATAVVLKRNNSDNRLQTATTLPADSALARGLVGAEPRACLAIRLGRPHQDGARHDKLLSCTVCSVVAGTASCQPLLVGGKVIGSVLIEQTRPLEEAERRSVADTVAQAAPVLANLKTIAIAENRASTDALTGLPNRRAMSDTVKRMAAHAGRTAEPLAAIAFDLDHFKTINDRYGHETGDAALSAVGECLRASLRESDFAARVGGEEFLVLAPDTDVAGAMALAGKLRDAIGCEQVPGLLQPITASFGVAVIPDHSAGFEGLLRRADRASYFAKERGRNRVEVASNDEPGTAAPSAKRGSASSEQREGPVSPASTAYRS